MRQLIKLCLYLDACNCLTNMMYVHPRVVQSRLVVEIKFELKRKFHGEQGAECRCKSFLVVFGTKKVLHNELRSEISFRIKRSATAVDEV